MKPNTPWKSQEPSKRALIKMVWGQHCKFDQEWLLTDFDRWFLTIKVIICILFDWRAKEDRPRWVDLYGEKSPNRFDLFWEEPVVVASYGHHEYHTMEYTAWVWWEVVVGRWNNDWRYDIRDDSSA